MSGWRSPPNCVASGSICFPQVRVEKAGFMTVNDDSWTSRSSDNPDGDDQRYTRTIGEADPRTDICNREKRCGEYWQVGPVDPEYRGCL